MIRLRLLSIGLACAALGGRSAWAAPARPQEPAASATKSGEAGFETRSFSIQDTRAVRALFDRAAGHVAARRWSSAIADLQLVLKSHRSDVLAGERLARGDGRIADQPTHPGAARRAREALFRLPKEAQDLYRERHDEEAEHALARARERSDRRALAEVARRWPLCRAAESAWWSLGDLELENGQSAEAVAAWSRALAARLGGAELGVASAEAWTLARERLEKRAAGVEPGADPGMGPGIDRRIAFALAWFERGARASAPWPPWSGSLHLAPPHESGGPPPGRNYDVWPAPFRLPDHPFQRRETHLFFPVRSAEVLLVSTSLRLLALQAYSGELLWDSGEPPGWSELSDNQRKEFFKGVDFESGMIAAAASDHVALAALQIPLAFVDNDTFQTIPIITIVPDRRLFAFDLDSGRALWDHRPPPAWDGESGGFTERMSIAGPPIVVGSRVLAPFCRMQGRIDYHVGCIDIDSGELLWSTDLISGQRELNMFGRPEHEFAAPPLVVTGDRVIALTQLGSLACLDLFTGELVWESLYQQIGLPKNKDYRAQDRKTVWRNAPPAIAGGVVVAAPFDSRELVGVDLAHGGQIWSLDNYTVQRMAGPRDTRINLLLGADENTVYLAGDKVIAIAAPGGLRAQAPTKTRWPVAFDHDDLGLAPGALPRPVLGKDRIVIPTRTQRIEIDLEQGRRIDAVDWSGGSSGGNMLLGAGELFTLSPTQVNGYFEWDALVARARAEGAAHPDDVRRALALGQLLSNRGAGEWQKGETESARVHLAEARAVFERALGPRPAAEADPALVRELHQVLRNEARVQTSLADSAGALRALHQARACAPDRAALRDTLLEELAILRAPDAASTSGAPAQTAARGSAQEARGEDRSEGRTEVLAELERSCGDLDLVCKVELSDERLLGGTAPLPRFTPEVGSQSASKSDSVPCEMPIGLWVLLERAGTHARALDTAAEFAELHAILARFPDVALPGGTAGEIASARIGGLLRAGANQGYAVFETSARAALEDALARRDREDLARVPRSFPFSQAALKANDVLLEWAIEGSQAADVAGIVLSELPVDWKRETATEREVGMCLRLAAVFGQRGNRELERELVRSLAESHPDLVSDLPAHQGRRLAEVAAGFERWTPPERLPASGTFDANCKSVARWEGEHRILGALVPDAPETEGPSRAPRDLLVLQSNASRRRVQLFTLSAERPGEKVVEAQLHTPGMSVGGESAWWSARVAFAAGRVIFVGGETVVGFDAANLERVWEWHAPGGYPESISIECASGVVVAILQTEGRSFLHALDARSGVELWREGPQEAGLRPVPLCSSNRLVFLPNSGRKQFLVRDLFTGRRAHAFEIEVPVTSTLDQEAWIEGDRLFLPWFTGRTPERNQLIAIDLADGRRAWRIGFGELGSDPLALEQILQCGQRTYLIAGPAQSSPQSRTLLELSTGIGAVAPLAHIRIGRDDRVLGAGRTQKRLRLADPVVFLLSKSVRSDEARLRAVDLEAGELWAQGLQVKIDELSGTIPVPALSDTSVAIAYTLFPPSAQSKNYPTSLVFFDRTSGLRTESRDLHEGHEKSDNIQLVALGDTLVIQGKMRLEVLR